MTDSKYLRHLVSADLTDELRALRHHHVGAKLHRFGTLLCQTDRLQDFFAANLGSGDQSCWIATEVREDLHFLIEAQFEPFILRKSQIQVHREGIAGCRSDFANVSSNGFAIRAPQRNLYQDPLRCSRRPPS